jgi:dGTPase
LVPEKHRIFKTDTYERLLHICHFLSLLTDGNALLFYRNINGNQE